jgi:hypothetical protein
VSKVPEAATFVSGALPKVTATARSVLEPFPNVSARAANVLESSIRAVIGP